MNPDSFENLAGGDLQNPRALLVALKQLRLEVDNEGRRTFEGWQPLIKRRDFLISALNLAHYLALRERDLRDLQTALMPWGLSSLGRIESRVIANLDAVIASLDAICGEPVEPPRLRQFFRGQRLLKRHTEAVFGTPQNGRPVRIMVTMPDEAIENYSLIRDWLIQGMDCIRINCAHNGPDEWNAIIHNLRRAEAETGQKCKVAMDLSGPKIRTEQVYALGSKRLKVGNRLLLTLDHTHESKAYDFQATCTIPEIFDQIEEGEPVWMDDGKVGLRVETAGAEGIVLEVTKVHPKGEKLKPHKGLNFPETALRIPALTDHDLKDLSFIARHADIINYSFVQSAADIAMLQAALVERTDEPERIAIIAKIETQRAIHNLPEIIVQAGGKQPFGVMIARGDLGVELGYKRLAEMQEEILWLCEAANVPVVWATQVLEHLVKKGIPSRAEITDAAMAERAECVMLNKGPYVGEAISLLDDVLRRMTGHQSKKTAQLRALRSWPNRSPEVEMPV